MSASKGLVREVGRRAAILIHYGRPQACALSVASFRAAEPDLPVHVIDNNSPEPAWRALVEALARDPQIELHRLPVNLGYAGAIASADRIAGGLDDCEVLFFGAHDAVVATHTLRNLESALAESGAALAFAAKTPAQRGHWTPVRGTWFSPISLEPGSHPRWVYGLFFPAALYAVTGDAYRAGLRPNADLFCYCEECDLGLRARALGLRTVLALDAPVLGANSTPSASAGFAQRLIARNLVRLASWHRGRTSAYFCALRLLSSSLRSRLRRDHSERMMGRERWVGALAGLRGEAAQPEATGTPRPGGGSDALGC